MTQESTETDFGLVSQSKKQCAKTSLTFSVCGTPQYMSPEILNEQGHDYLSDWWALGITIYELASGDPPFNNRDLEQMADDIRFEDFPLQSYFSKDLKSLLLGLTDKIPSKRLGHCSNGGIDAIKKHAFFKKVDWSCVLNK